MKYIIMDLEWNGTYAPRLGKFFNEIIEFGAVCLDDDFRIVAEFSTFVAPTYNKKLTGRVKRLTHISNSDLSGASKFTDVFEHFCYWVGKEENTIITFGTADIVVMLENLEVYGMTERMSFMHNYCDLQQLCQRMLEENSGQQLGLSVIAEKLGIEIDSMEMHRALDDSLVSADCFVEAFDDDLFDELSYVADAEFYKWLTFKAVTIADSRNPLIEKNMFMIPCPHCGVLLKRNTSVSSHNHAFVAEYSCGVCKRKYRGRCQFKIKYEGLTKRVTLTELGTETDNEPTVLGEELLIESSELENITNAKNAAQE